MNWRKTDEFRNMVSVRCKGQVGTRLGHKFSEVTKRKISKANTGKIHSEETRKRMSISKIGLLSGDKHPNWKGGIPQQRNWNVYYWSKSIIARDKECMFPGCTSDEKLHAHHIKRFSENKEISTDINNGITLCISCHRKTYFKEQYYENLFKKIVEFVS